MFTTNRIALLVFIALLTAVVLIFKVRQPAHKVMLQVEHVFAASVQKPPVKAPQVTVAKSEEAHRQTHPKPKTKEMPKKANSSEKNPPIKATHKPSQKSDKTQPALAKTSGQVTITVNKERYMELLQEWMRDNGKGGAAQVIPLQVENLENTYTLLQMKPVAEVGKRLIDLTDGSVLSQGALSGYSATVFEVRDPWQKLAKELRQAAIRQDQPITVRYYMYDFVFNGIYQRVGKAYAWCLSRQLLPTDTKPTDIDVLGRTFVIASEDGGRFGVFVPLMVRTKDGHEIKIDPACLSEYADVAALQAGGVL